MVNIRYRIQSYSLSLLVFGIGAIQRPALSQTPTWTPSGTNYYVTPATTKVGIGTSTPGANLEVWSPSGREDILSLYQNSKQLFNFQGADNGTAAYLAMFNNAGTMVNKIDGRANNVTFFNGGNVGIGTTSPASLNNRGKVLEVSAAGGNNWLHPGIVLRSGSNYGAVQAWEMLLSSGSVGGTTDFQLMSGGAGRLMVVGNSGNVGINTTSPATKLDVRGSIGIYDGTLSGDTYQRTVIYSDNNNGLLFEAPKNAAGDKYDITFSWRGGGRTPLFMKGTNSYVGIGHTNPQAQLDVNGDAKVSGALEVASIKTKTWTVAPDYVFEQDYKMASLQEVESFVQKNKHLPEVPSAKTIKEKGLDLAEMNLLLLKKVEELTLHAIRQEKEMKRQAEEIRGLKVSSRR